MEMFVQIYELFWFSPINLGKLSRTPFKISVYKSLFINITSKASFQVNSFVKEKNKQTNSKHSFLRKSLFSDSEIKSVPVATVKTHSRIYIKYFLHNITLQLLFILINKYSLCNCPKYRRERLGMVRRMETSIPKPCPQNKSTSQNNKDRNQIF